jgi:Predicted transcriptional regulator
MDNSTIGQRLKTARERKGLFQEKLAELIGVTSGKIISNWETGIAKPDADKIVKLCSVLGVSAAYMLDYYDNEKGTISDDEYNKLKIYRALDEHGQKMIDITMDCEYERLLENIAMSREEPKTQKSEPKKTGRQARKFRRITYYDNAASAGTGQYLENTNQQTIKIPLNEMSDQADYVIPIRGDSMEPMFSDMDRICIRYQVEIEEGEIGIFILNGESYVKEFGVDRLISINPTYPDIVIGEFDEVVCRGKVLGKI